MLPLRAETERWFVARGVPHLIEDYHASQRIWTRARPFLVAVLLLQVVVAFGDRYRGVTQGVMVIVASVLLLVAIGIFNRSRGRRLFDVPDEVGWPELAFFVVAPALLALAVGGAGWWSAVLSMAVNGAILIIAFVVVGFGLIPMTRWSITKLVEHIRVLVRLVARTLPVLLVLTVFMFINAEIWQVAYTVEPPGFLVVGTIIAGIGLGFLWLSTDRMLDDVGRFDGWAEALSLAGSSPVATITAPAGSLPPLDLDRGARANLRILLVVGVSTQVTLVAGLVALFYVLIGLIIVTPEVLVQWTGTDDLHQIAALSIGSFEATLTFEHLRVSGLIGVLAGLNVVVSALTDDLYRETFTADLVAEIEQNLAVCSIYRSLDDPDLFPGGRPPAVRPDAGSA